MIRALLVTSILAPAAAYAQSAVTVTLSPTGQAAATAAGYSSADFASAIKTQVDNAYQTNNVQGFLRSFTDATGFSQRGLGVDYVSVPNSFIVGIAANAAVASDSLLTSDQRPTSGGAAVNFGAMIGMNLGTFDLKRWTVYANGFYQTASTDRLTGTLISAGAHLQYKLLQAEEGGGSAALVRWIGLDVTGGVEYTNWNLGANDGGVKNNFDIPAMGTGISESVTLTSSGAFNLKTNAVTVPVEVTTGLRIALIASIFIGAGVDFTYGKTTVDANLNGDMTDQNGTNLGTVNITANGSNTGSPASGRVLAGVQLNLWKLKIFVQGNVSQTPAASVAAGIRLVI
jgi:hypothetical protein